MLEIPAKFTLDAFVQMLKLMEVNADDPLRTLTFLLLLKYTFEA